MDTWTTFPALPRSSALAEGRGKSAPLNVRGAEPADAYTEKRSWAVEEVDVEDATTTGGARAMPWPARAASARSWNNSRKPVEAMKSI